jgi:hypothetical protein
MRVQAGDWVSYYQAGKLVVGVVRYVRDRKQYPYEPEVLCDIGSVDLDAILEVRRGREDA